MDNVREIILSRIDVDDATGCWNWTGAISSNGYGHMQWQNKTLSTHRLSYECFVGPIPDGKSVCHSCDNRKCLNPEHLWIGTHSDNMSDMVIKGRAAVGDRNIARRHPEIRRGSKNGRSKLNSDIVRSARELYVKGGITYRELAERYGVALQVMYRAVKGISWRHVK